MSAVSYFYSVFLAVLCYNLVSASNVELKNNGYENILIAINPQVPENAQIISNIKTMMEEASLFLFNATKRRFYYKEVKILIPYTWQSSNYRRPKSEVYQKASIIVTNPNVIYGNDPYTLHYEGCAKEGKYIHFSSDFLTDDSLISVYGPRGKVFVHEWAHLRWGVYDEYSYNAPFFVSVENKIRATRCSSELSGMYVCKETSCSDGDCLIDPQTGNLAEGCMFLVNSTQKSKASIMYMQAISSVVEFCNENNHDQEAPNMQNRMCSYRSTWDVIMSSPDFRSTMPMPGQEYPPPPSFSVFQTRTRFVCLVLDASESMATGERIHRLHQAAAIFLLHFVETGSHVGIITYNETAEVRSPLRQIDSDYVRRNLTSYLPKTASGKTCICKGILSALQLLRSDDGSGDGGEIILVAAGKDENLRGCISNVSLSGSVIHTIAMGPSADKDLETLAELTGGSAYFASDNKDSNSLIGAFSELYPTNGDPAQQLVKLSLVSRLTEAGGQLAGWVFIDSSIWKNTLFIITWQLNELPEVIIQDPAGNNYTAENQEIDTAAQVAYFSVSGTSQVGTWTYRIINTLNSSQIVGILVTSVAASEKIPPVVSAHTNTKKVTSPEPMIIFAEVRQGFSAILGVNVTAIIEPDFGDPMIVTLADDGAGADAVKGDGIYSRYVFSFNHSGRHSLKLHAEWNSTASLTSLQNSQAMYVPGYIENGTIRMNPPKPIAGGESQLSIQTFSRIVFVGSFKVANVSKDTIADVFPPCRIIDLEAKMESDNVVLSWTAPGDNFDQGAASMYEIRMSDSPWHLREDFDSATLINTSALKPQHAGCKENFSFIINRKGAENGNIIYIAIRSIDDILLQSDVSNLVHVTRPAQLLNTSYAYSTAVEKSSTATVIFVVVSLVSICISIGASIYSFRKYFLSKPYYRVMKSDLRPSQTSIEEMKTVTEHQVELFPLRVISHNSYCDVITSVTEENDSIL
ncbi:calcium-activated chloride channel regulator 1-like [Spea bombifrons]|uniref:calcium-activated chloride channel regulator 1-like n=1 Tax=Spea bombifrons TaxID=233779 RepID=UPI00234BA0F8|nr:calcium-activated chloride channel regulator 1-like [Spea bombifrons]